MRRILLVAGDRALTKFMAEALLARSLANGAPRAQDPWDIARAHSGLEAFLLITKGGRTFDILVVEQKLPDQDALDLLDKLKRGDHVRNVPVFMLTERGRDQHVRRMASEHFSVAGYLEKPVTAESLRAALGNLERKRRVLLVDSNVTQIERLKVSITQAGYLIDACTRGREALDRLPRLKPDAVVVSLALEDMRGAEVCVEIKQTRPEIPIVLFGTVAELASQEITENAHRADDFIESPFEDPALVERIASLIGRGVSAVGAARPRPTRPAKTPTGGTIERPAIPPAETAAINPNDASSVKATREYIKEALGADQPPSAPPPSASPKAAGPTKRSTRRVPCQISMAIRNGDKVYTSKTLDISHGGIFLATDEPLEIGTLIDMTFQIPNTTHVVNAVGKVAWAERAPDGVSPNKRAGVGVKFSKIQPSDLQMIVDYVNRVARVVYSAS